MKRKARREDPGYARSALSAPSTSRAQREPFKYRSDRAKTPTGNSERGLIQVGFDGQFFSEKYHNNCRRHF